MHLFVDGTNVVHRAFFALAGPRLDRCDDPGRVAGAARIWIARWQTRFDVHPNQVLVAFDGPNARAPRRAICPAYKARRPLTKHPVLVEALNAMRMLVLGTDWSCRAGVGLEADDLIAQAAQDATAGGVSALIISTDGDLFQCLSPQVSQFRYDSSQDGALWTLSRFEQHYGFRPSSFADYKALAGDPSDGIAGVDGIGIITAARLLGVYGTLEGIAEHLDDIRPLRIQTILRRGMDHALTMRLVTRLPFQNPTTPATAITPLEESRV